MKFKWKMLAAIFVAIMGMVAFIAPPSYAYNWTLSRTMSDSAGNGTLTVGYRADLDGDGINLQWVRITADSGGLTYQGAAGKGASCWNGAGTVKWSKGVNDTSLNPGQSKIWYPDQIWDHADSIRCGWYFTDVFVPGSDVNQCTKVVFLGIGEGETHGC